MKGVVHHLSNRDQPYGSSSLKCEFCGVALIPLVSRLFVRDDLSYWQGLKDQGYTLCTDSLYGRDQPCGTIDPLGGDG